MKVKKGSHLYQVPPRRVAYALEKPLKEKLEWLQTQRISIPLGADKIYEWCNSFILVPKANGKLKLCLDLVQINEALIRPIHMGPVLNDILLRLTGVK